MSSSFADSFNQFADDSPAIVPDQQFDDGYLGPYAFSTDSKAESVYASDPVELYSDIADGPILPPPAQMEPEEGYALREWRRENAIRLEEKEKREKQLLSEILVEADEYKAEFHKKRQINVEANKEINREKEKAFVAIQDKFYAEANKDYWKSISELIPKEVVSIEKRKAKKDQEKKPSAVVLQGPKPGKPTDLTRMRQLLVKLKHNTPSHLKDSPKPVASVARKAPAEAVAVV